MIVANVDQVLIVASAAEPLDILSDRTGEVALASSRRAIAPELDAELAGLCHPGKCSTADLRTLRHRPVGTRAVPDVAATSASRRGVVVGVAIRVPLDLLGAGRLAAAVGFGLPSRLQSGGLEERPAEDPLGRGAGGWCPRGSETRGLVAHLEGMLRDRERVA